MSHPSDGSLIERTCFKNITGQLSLVNIVARGFFSTSQMLKRYRSASICCRFCPLVFYSYKSIELYFTTCQLLYECSEGIFPCIHYCLFFNQSCRKKTDHVYSVCSVTQDKTKPHQKSQETFLFLSL